MNLKDIIAGSIQEGLNMKNDIKRYDVEPNHYGGVDIDECEDGRFCEAEDIEKLEKKLERYEKALSRIRGYQFDKIKYDTTMDIVTTAREALEDKDND